MSGDTQSRHCWRLMLVVSLAHTADVASRPRSRPFPGRRSAGLMSYQHVVGAEGWPFRQRAGGLVIHLPSVVRTSSPSCTFVIVVLLPTRFVRRFS
jgi:hypothetical protein